MDIEILSAGPEDDTELRVLYAWLREDPELRGAEIRLVRAEQPGTMGSVLEAVHVILSDAAAVGGFALSLATWLGTRAHARTRTLRSPGGERELPERADAEAIGSLLVPGPGSAPGQVRPDGEPGPGEGTSAGGPR